MMLDGAECDAMQDIHPDGTLHCVREAGHPGMHRGSGVYWLPQAPAIEVVAFPGWEAEPHVSGGER
jgi:hypothetical protein